MSGLNDAPRLLLVRLSALGDAVHGLPLLCALRTALPRAYLAWAAEPAAAELLAGHPALDERVLLARGWYKRPAGLVALARQLRQKRFDVAVDMQGLTKSGLLAWLSGARRRIGFGDDKGRELSRLFYTETVRSDARHVVDANRALVGPLGIDAAAGTADFGLVERTEDAVAAERLLAGLPSAGGGFCLLNVGASWPSKQWPAERFAAVAVALARRGLVPIVVAGSAAERARAQTVADASKAATVAPPMSLAVLAAVMRRARFVVSGDTGPLHLAAAVGTPCVALFGPTSAERNGPYGPGHVVVQKRPPPETRHGRRHAGNEYIEAIETADVLAACDVVSRGGTAAGA